jgi:hypothetical protein
MNVPFFEGKNELRQDFLRELRSHLQIIVASIVHPFIYHTGQVWYESVSPHPKNKKKFPVQEAVRGETIY